tara:strand:- start:151 stop:324 length:174 start_codon:yes stop_codon:yes gene_type:complete
LDIALKYNAFASEWTSVFTANERLIRMQRRKIELPAVLPIAVDRLSIVYAFSTEEKL